LSIFDSAAVRRVAGSGCVAHCFPWSQDVADSDWTFVSYSHRDSEQVKSVIDALVDHGLKI
jgi:hypothetical protein|tara:strand:- start:921 stop:1103 length:183 start_codon:yes stop_codon:yes gene_type:complete